MNEAVTYADLQFVNLSLKECQESEAEDNEEEDGAMYENVNPNLNISSRRAQNSAQGNRGQVAGGPLKLASNLTLFVLLFCLVLIASMIGTTIKYFQVSRELQDISTIYIELNSSLSQAIQHKEEELTLTYRAFTNSQNELKQLVENHKKLNRTLHLCQVTEQQTNEKLTDMGRLYSETMVKNQQVMEEKQEIQIHLEDKDNQLRLLNEETCPDKWIRFGMRCLYFSEEEKRTWEKSRIFCENQKASLLLLRQDDWKLKEFITKKQNDYWVGKFDYYEPKEFLRYCWNNCVKFSNGEPQSTNKNNQLRWICERKLVLLEVNTNPRDTYKYCYSSEKKDFYCKS